MTRRMIRFAEGRVVLDIALKEWAVVCDLLLEGGLAVLLRKGGIAETGGPGVFDLEHGRFALFPSWAHQKPEMIKPQFRGRVETLAEPAQLTMRAVGVVSKIWQVKSRAAFDTLDDLHCWTAAQIDMRFSYKPERPLYLMAVRCYRLASPKTIDYRAAYAGCKSWVPLARGDEVDDQGAKPVFDDSTFGQIVARIDRVM